MIPNYELLSLNDKIIHTNEMRKMLRPVLKYYKIDDIVEIYGRMKMDA